MKLKQDQLKALGEVIASGVGQAAASLSDLLDTPIALHGPETELISRLDQQYSDLAFVQRFDGGISGTALLSFPAESARRLASRLAGYDGTDSIPEFELSGVLSEVGNIVLNDVLGALSNYAEADLAYSMPDFFVDRPLQELVPNYGRDDMANQILIANARLSVSDDDIKCSVVIGFESGALERLIDSKLAISEN